MRLNKNVLNAGKTSYSEYNSLFFIQNTMPPAFSSSCVLNSYDSLSLDRGKDYPNLFSTMDTKK